MTKARLLIDLENIKIELKEENKKLYQAPCDMTNEIRYNEGYISAIEYIAEQIKKL